MTAFISKVFEIHQKQFPNKDIQNNPLAIGYSATPGMGKSTLTKKIVDKFNANILENDAVRDILDNFGFSGYSEEMNPFIKEYMARLIQKIQKDRPNKLIIFDSMCDRKYALMQN